MQNTFCCIAAFFFNYRNARRGKAEDFISRQISARLNKAFSACVKVAHSLTLKLSLRFAAGAHLPQLRVLRVACFWCQRDLRLIKNIYKVFALCVCVCALSGVCWWLAMLACNRNVTWLLLLRCVAVIVAAAAIVVVGCYIVVLS